MLNVKTLKIWDYGEDRQKWESLETIVENEEGRSMKGKRNSEHKIAGELVFWMFNTTGLEFSPPSAWSVRASKERIIQNSLFVLFYTKFTFRNIFTFLFSSNIKLSRPNTLFLKNYLLYIIHYYYYYCYHRH